MNSAQNWPKTAISSRLSRHCTWVAIQRLQGVDGFSINFKYSLFIVDSFAIAFACRNFLLFLGLKQWRIPTGKWDGSGTQISVEWFKPSNETKFESDRNEQGVNFSALEQAR